jgi:hypothetical protein
MRLPTQTWDLGQQTATHVRRDLENLTAVCMSPQRLLMHAAEMGMCAKFAWRELSI